GRAWALWRRRARRRPGLARADGVPGGARTRASRRGPTPARVARPSQRAVRLHVRRLVPRAARPDRGERLRRLRRLREAVGAGEAGRRRQGPVALRAAVVGGGLAGIAAALELVDA